MQASKSIATHNTVSMLNVQMKLMKHSQSTKVDFQPPFKTPLESGGGDDLFSVLEQTKIG